MVEQITLSGVVLKAMPISEYDKRLVILTKERGKITAFARGARRQNSSFLAGSQPMVFGEFTVYQGRNSYTVTGIKVTKYFAQELTDIEKMSYGMYFLELADYYGREGIEAADMLNLLFLSMKALQNSAIPDRLVRVIYELKTMVINGEYPNMFTCVNCGNDKELDIFDRKNNGMLCISCHGVDRRFISVDDSTRYALQYVITAKMSKLYTFNVKEEVLVKMEQIVNSYLSSNVDRQFKSLEFL